MEEGGKGEGPYGRRRNRVGIFFQSMPHHYDFQPCRLHIQYAAIGDFEVTGRAQPPTAVRAFQAVVTQEQSLLPESRELEAHELLIEHVDSDEGGLEMDPETPLCSVITTSRNWKQARTRMANAGGMEVGMEVGVEELLAQDEWVVQEAFKQNN